jgi:hypothetical protein
MVRAFQRDTDVALEHIARATGLSPLDPLMFSMQMATGHAHYIAGRYAEAATWAGNALREQPNLLPTIRLMACDQCAIRASGGSPQGDRARAAPSIPVCAFPNLKDRVGPFQPEDFVRYEQALRLAGLPE